MKKYISYFLIAIHLFVTGFSGGTYHVPTAYSSFGGEILNYDAQDMNGDGSNITGEPSNADSVSDWQEVISSYTGSQADISRQPVYNTGSISNRYPWVTFDGVNDMLEVHDHTNINLSETYSEKSFWIVLETGTDITTLQTIYEQWHHEKWYGFQISNGHLYGGVWNTVDWSPGDQRKIIDYGVITADTDYFITLVHDNSEVSGYLDGTLVTTLTGASTQTIHGICQIDTPFGCSIYSTGGTIGIGATQNDTLDLENETTLNTYQGNYFQGTLWEINSWNSALSALQVTNLQAYYVSKWRDDTAPVISSYSPNNNSLFPIWNMSLAINYTDELGGSGIDDSTGSSVLQKWNSGISNWGPDISGSFITSSSISTSSGTFDVTGLDFGRYQATLSISDYAGNSTSQVIEFYVDDVELTLSTGALDIGWLQNGLNWFSNELEITVRTVWAGFDLLLKENTDLTVSGDTIDNFNGTQGYGYDSFPYTSTITNFAPVQTIATQSGSLNTDGQKNTYSYRIQIGALIEAQQAAWNYSGLIDVGIDLTYE